MPGAAVNPFFVQSARKQPEAVIERERILWLSRRDCEKLLDLLEDAPTPNARFEAAMKHYQNQTRR